MTASKTSIPLCLTLHPVSGETQPGPDDPQRSLPTPTILWFCVWFRKIAWAAPAELEPRDTTQMGKTTV